jgi:hypothetical protein
MKFSDVDKIFYFESKEVKYIGYFLVVLVVLIIYKIIFWEND